MAELGVLPSRTSVTVTITDDGQNATLKAATPQQAGVMTADQARVLEQVRELLSTGHIQANSIGQESSALAIENFSLPPVEVLPPNHTGDMLKRILALERGSTSNVDYASLTNAFTTFRDQVAKRLLSLERRIAKVETNDNTPTIEIQQIHQESRELMTMLEELVSDPTPVMVESD